MSGNERESIYNLLRSNRRTKDGYTYTVPSPELYPFQWFWDSCFHATILAHYDIEEARDEIRAVVARPLQNGLLPHIIYWEDDYRITNWGREMRGDVISRSWGTDGTSAITQPPLIAVTVFELHMKYPDRQFLAELYPVLMRHYRALLAGRDVGRTGLVGIINPDESGEDNSPRFDAALNLPGWHTDHENLDRRIILMEQNVRCGFDAYNCMRPHFWVEDVTFNVVLKCGLEALAKIAESLGERADAKFWKKSADDTHRAIRRNLCSDGICYSLTGLDQEEIRIDTWGVLTPLFGNILTKEEATTLVETYLGSERKFRTKYPIPSVAVDQEVYQPDDFWRGPTWMAINWFVYKGLMNYGFVSEAAMIRERSIALVAESGFREYYHPETGAGLGATNFTWGGLIVDME